MISEEKLNDSSQSLSTEQCRSILGRNYANLTDQEIEQLRISMEMLADMTIQAYKRSKASDSLIQKSDIDTIRKENV